MYFNTRAPMQPPSHRHTASDRVREMLAHIVSPSSTRAPTRGEMSQLLSTAVDKCYPRMVRLMEAATAMFSSKDTWAQVAPDSYPLPLPEPGSSYLDNDRARSSTSAGKVQGSLVLKEAASPTKSASVEPNKHVDRALGTPGDDVIDMIDDYLADLESESAPTAAVSLPGSTFEPAHIVPVPGLRLSRAPDASVDDVIGLIDDYLEDLARDSIVPTASSTSVESDSTAVYHSPRVRGLALNAPKSAPSALRFGSTHGQTTRYSDQQTLTVPSIRLPSRPLPSHAERVVREVHYELKTLGSRKHQYTACELAYRGIFLHRPVEDSQTTGACPNKSRNREVSVGPLKGNWSWADKEVELPRIEISKPDDRNITTAHASDQEPTPEYCELMAPSVSSFSPSPAKRTRGRPDAILVVAKPSAPPTKSVTEAPPKTTLAPARDNLPLTVPSSSRPCASTPRISPALLARKMRGRPSSMSDWLAQFGTGGNPFVDQSIVESACPVLQAALTSSPPSSPESSPPSTPPINAQPLPPVTFVKEDRSARSSYDRRRRAQYSYDAGQYDIMVAPAIPGLATHELRVAC